MFTFQFGDTSVSVNFLSVICTILFIAILAAVIFFIAVVIEGFSLRKKAVRLVEDVRGARYYPAISLAEDLLETYRRSYQKLKTKKLAGSIDAINIQLAIAYFGLSDRKRFLEQLDQVDDSDTLKHFWLALDALQTDDLDRARIHYEIFAPDSRLDANAGYIAGILACKQGQYEEGKRILEEVYPKFTYQLLKDIAKQYMEE